MKIYRRQEKYEAGIDIGSTTVKVILADVSDIVYTSYTRHNADIHGTIVKELNSIKGQYGDIQLSLAVTGSAGMGLSESFGLAFIQEVVAAAHAVKFRFPQTSTLIDVGGEDTKMIFFDTDKAPDMRMNGNCAGGTGAFIDQMAALLNMTGFELNARAEKHGSIFPIASRCGVFAKTDVQNLLSNNVCLEDIAASIFHAVAVQAITTLSRGRDVIPKVLFSGGPLSFLTGLRRAFIRVLDLQQRDVLCPAEAKYIPAIGAALWNSHKKNSLSLKELIDLLAEKPRNRSISKTTHLPQLFASKEELDLWGKSKSRADTSYIDLQKLHEKDVFIGIDGGSTTTKIVMIDASGRIAFSYYAHNHGNHIEAVKAGLKKLREELLAYNANPIVRRTAVTGYGENLIQAAFGIDDGIVETTAHFLAARFFDQDVTFILDIGGQDMKAIFVRDKMIDNIEINEACSSGCGSFIESFAQSLGYDVEKFAMLGCTAAEPCDLGSRCTVFMNSKVKQSLREGTSIGDISAGLAYSVIKNCLHKVLKIHDADRLGNHICVQGGTFCNPAVLRALELLLERDIIRPEICGIMGAYGAALMARDNNIGESTFIGFNDLDTSASYSEKTVRCKGCRNNCRVSHMTFSNGCEFYAGQRCEKIFSNNTTTSHRGKNIYEKKYALLFTRNTMPENPAIASIGIPRALNIFEHYPFWCTLFVEAGFEVVLSSHSSPELLEKGSSSVMSDNICFPAKLTHGHIMDLIAKGVNRIFFPMVNYEENEFEHSVNSYNCPIVTGYPDVIRNAINPDAQGIPFDNPHVVFNNQTLLRDACYEYLTGLGIDKTTFSRAFTMALRSQQTYREDIKDLGRCILEDAEKTGRMVIMLAGRPYHLDPLVNHHIPELIAGFGVDVITDDAIPDNQHSDLHDIEVLTQWEYSNRLYRAAQWEGDKANIEFVQLNSFGCGPDAITVDEIKAVLSSCGKRFISLRIDDVMSMGSVRLRIRSLIESLRLTKKHEERDHNKITRRKTSPFFAVPDRNKTILSPYFSPMYSCFIEAAAKKMGYTVKTLPPSDDLSVQIGLKYTNNDICYPAIICIGDIIKALQSGAYDLNNTAAAITETGGPCRASNYASLMKKALLSAGFDAVPVITLAADSSLNKQPGFALPLHQVLLMGLSVSVYADTLTKMYYATAAREKTKGEAKTVLKKYQHLAINRMGTYTIRNAFDLLNKACCEFNNIAIGNDLCPQVGILGEIYVKYNPFGNNYTINWLMNNGVEVLTPGLLTFLTERFIDVETNVTHHIRRTNPLLLKGYRLVEKIINRSIKKANIILHRLNHGVIPIHTIRELSHRARNILSLGHQYGEGWLIAAEIADMAENGVRNILCLQPFGCIANHVVAKGIAKRIRELYPGLNIQFIDMDAGASEVNMHNRLQLILHSARSEST